jgi:hypothetical protein
MNGKTRKLIVKSTLLLVSVILLANIVGALDDGVVHAASVTTFSKTYGGSSDDEANAVIQTSDGGYAMAGWTASYGNGYYNFWLVKTDSSGNQKWTQAYGSSGDNEAEALVQTSDDGYALAGFTNSTGTGVYSFWLVKTDSNGNIEWSKSYGGSGDNEAYAIAKTSDGGFILAGYTTSAGTGGRQILLVKTDSNGNVIWNQTYGGPGDTEANAVIQTSDGGYAVAGCTDTAGAGSLDFYLMKVNSNGVMLWNQTYGGPGDDIAYSLVQTSDGGYAMAGYSYSFTDGYNNFWLVKTDSNGNMQWSQTYDGGGNSQGSSLVGTSDGGFAVAGSIDTSSGEAFRLVKTDATGDMVWNQMYEPGDSYATSLIQASDGGYAVAGYTDATGAGGYDFYLVKTTSTGATSTSSAFSWTSLEGLLVIAAIVIIVLGLVLFLLARTRRSTSYPH